jgi:hypothetical protein
MSLPNEPTQVDRASRVVAGTATLVAAIVGTHVLAAPVRAWAGEAAPLAAGALTLAAAAVAMVGIAVWPRRAAPLWAALAGLPAAVLVELVHAGAFPAALALVPAGLMATFAGGRLLRRLPPGLDVRAARRPLLAAVWVIAALTAVVQTGRLATYMTDPEFDWFVSTRHPFYAKHECASAYFFAAELSARGEANVYDAAHYPGLNPQAEPVTAIRGMSPEDPYQYAPQFLLWPRLAISLTHDYDTLRLSWFGLQYLLAFAAVFGLARFSGGRVGMAAAYASPFVFASFPMLHNLQYGQFHFASVALAVFGMMALAAGRRAVGGTVLAVSVLSKLFPAVLLVVLAAQRRWRDLGWTVAAMVVLTLLALAWIGPAPFVAFLDYHVPRLSSGEAFAFGEAWPEVRELVLAGNQGVVGLVDKLEWMGFPRMGEATAVLANRVFGVALLLFAAWSAHRLRGASRENRATLWLALLGAASLVSAGAWADYVPLTAVWLATYWIGRLDRRPVLGALVGGAAALQFFGLGGLPIGSFASPAWMMPLSAIGAVSMIGLFGGAAFFALRDAGPARRRLAVPRRGTAAGWQTVPVPAEVPRRR